MSGKTCVVTGATSGIGEVAALELARRGATVVIVGRNAEKCATTVDRLRRETGNEAVESLVADLSVQADIRRLAQDIQERFDRLDVLLNNAGAMFPKRRESADGIEMTLALNHLGYFLLTLELLERLKASAPSRVVNVASDAHRMVRGIDFDDLQARRSYRGFRLYGQSKLANILFTRELARRLEGTGVTANALHPGFVATNFMAGEGLANMAMRGLARVLALSPEKGAETSTYLATSPDVEGVSGRYFVQCKPAEPTSAGRDDEAARRLWEVSEQLTGRAS